MQCMSCDGDTCHNTTIPHVIAVLNVNNIHNIVVFTFLTFWISVHCVLDVIIQSFSHFPHFLDLLLRCDVTVTHVTTQQFRMWSSTD